MNFYYLISNPTNNQKVLRLNCPYIIEDAAISLMQTYISENERVMALPAGDYIATLLRKKNDNTINGGYTRLFTLYNNRIEWS